MTRKKQDTHRSSSTKKLYAVKDAKGRFKDIQEYEKAHRKSLLEAAKEEEAEQAIKEFKRGTKGV